MILPKSVRQTQEPPIPANSKPSNFRIFGQWRDRAHESTWALIERHASTGNQVTEADQS